jgi:hypothetical protein
VIQLVVFILGLGLILHGTMTGHMLLVGTWAIGLVFFWCSY